jgi:copper chaperone
MLQTQKERFKVVGMYCVTCKPIVENQFGGEQAIRKIDIDFVTDSVVVGYNSQLMTKEKIKEKLENPGYKFVKLAAR